VEHQSPNASIYVFLVLPGINFGVGHGLVP